MHLVSTLPAAHSRDACLGLAPLFTTVAVTDALPTGSLREGWPLSAFNVVPIVAT